MTSASLRQQAAERLNASWRWLRGLPDDQPVLPPFAPQLFKLAHIAVGDADSAAVLVADSIALQPRTAPFDEAVVLQLLVSRLPEGWLSWPGAAGPAEWLRLRLRREQADRLLSVLGEWDAPARVALGLWLLWGVRRDDLDAWLGTQGMADRVCEFVGYVGEGLDLVPPLGDQPSCADVAPDLLDAHEPQVGRLVRLHTLGCQACRRRVSGLQATTALLREALNTFFRTPMPTDLARIVELRRRELRQLPSTVWRPLVIAAVLALLYIGVVRKPAATAAPAPVPQNAAEILDRALNRFTRAPPTEGVLHERVQLLAEPSNYTIERWYDYAGTHRLRITVRQGTSQLPLLDVSADGVEQITYVVNPQQGSAHSGRVRNRDTPQALALLRQLPVVGSFGGAIVPQRYLDLNLLAAAQRGNPMLLGTNRWHGRAAFTLVSTTAVGERLILTLDQVTSSLLEARIASTVGSASTARTVWQAELVEVVPRQQVPSATFQIPAQLTNQALLNPRQLHQRLAPVDLDTAVRSSVLALPAVLPDATELAFIRDRSRVHSSVTQWYEGQWSTLVIEAPRFAEPLRRKPLDQRFARGAYSEVKHDVPQTTMLVFTLDSLPNRRMRLYLWHALLSDQERTALSRSLLDALIQADADTVPQFRNRFFSSKQQQSGADTTLDYLPQTQRISVDARRRFGRLKADQALAQIEAVPSDFAIFLP